MGDVVIPKILIDYKRYLHLTQRSKETRVTNEEKPAVSNVGGDSPPEKVIPTTDAEGPSVKKLKQERPSTPPVPNTLKKELQNLLDQVPSETRSAAQECVNALVDLKRASFRDDAVWVGKKMVMTATDFLRTYGPHYHLANELALCKKISRRARDFKYAPTLPHDWYKL